MIRSNRYRTHTCGALRASDIGATVRLSGWLARSRNLGALLFFDLRDRWGTTQCFLHQDSPLFALAGAIRRESTVRVVGRVVRRESVNPDLPTGEIEVVVDELEVLGAADPVPFQVVDDPNTSEATRLKHRYLDLRRERMVRALKLRSDVIASLRRRMIEQGFQEYQTPILTASSPEGARDYLVPSRRYPGHFYALPQAPQIFKQLLMVGGQERYFQIAPCFRDEDARADRSPGEFYQLDVEMSFVEQDDVFAAIEPVLEGVFREFSTWKVTPAPFPRIAYRDALLRYGSDKPDLRNPLEIRDLTAHFPGSGFGVFEGLIAQGAVVRALPVPGGAGLSRKAWAELEEVAKAAGAGGMAWIALAEGGAKGGLARFFEGERLARLGQALELKEGDGACFLCGPEERTAKQAGLLRDELGRRLGLIEPDSYRFCWIVDYPFYERNEETGAIEFSHNPFSMPQGGLEALEHQDPLQILAYQYDIVCNGVELSSGAIRNHRPDIMRKAFELAGYSAEDVQTRFSGLWTAFHYGPPPHGGLAPGVDRMVMLLAQEKDIREIIAFPMNQQAQDLMMGAPATVRPEQLRELHLSVVWPEKKDGGAGA